VEAFQDGLGVQGLPVGVVEDVAAVEGLLVGGGFVLGAALQGGGDAVG